MPRPIPEWFAVTEAANSETMRRIEDSVSSCAMSPQVKSAPMLAYWFMLDSLLLANQANREAMHANALGLTRQCVEAMGVIELGLCRHAGAEAALLKWEADSLTPGKLRAWLQDNVWASYGRGLWAEPWTTFMREFAAAIQPYAHYSRGLAQWQVRLRSVSDPTDEGGDLTAIIEMKRRAYDPQKATRITLFHGLLTYTLGRIWIAANPGDTAFESPIARLGAALGRSRYLDGYETNWGQQFWAMLWESGGGLELE